MPPSIRLKSPLFYFFKRSISTFKKYVEVIVQICYCTIIPFLEHWFLLLASSSQLFLWLNELKGRQFSKKNRSSLLHNYDYYFISKKYFTELVKNVLRCWYLILLFTYFVYDMMIIWLEHYDYYTYGAIHKWRHLPGGICQKVTLLHKSI